MRTNIEIDDELMSKALKGSGIRTKKEVVETALKLLIQTRQQSGILKLRGKTLFYDGVVEENAERAVGLNEKAR
jgi:Arc/MetJ family transcription regulator